MRTELHFHLLPAVDDGPRDDDEALALARLAVADGTRTVVATPHAHAIAPAEVHVRVAALTALLDANHLPLTVHPGIELLPTDVLRLDACDLARIAQGPRGRRWVLLEAPLDGSAPGAAGEALDKLRRHGFGALIAHPERSPEWWRDDGALDRALDVGARLQVNASSLTGFHGPDAQRRAFALARHGQITVLASDAHHEQRPPCLTAALALLARRGIPAERLVDDHPAALLAHGLPALAHEARAA